MAGWLASLLLSQAGSLSFPPQLLHGCEIKSWDAMAGSLSFPPQLLHGCEIKSWGAKDREWRLGYGVSGWFT